MADVEQPLPLELKEENSSSIGSFDPSKKKKKKKERAVVPENEDSPSLNEKMEELSVSEAATDSQFAGMKKKKKKKPVDGELLEDASVEKTESKAMDESSHTESSRNEKEGGEGGEESSTFSSLPMKKKKKKKVVSLSEDVEGEEGKEKGEEGKEEGEEGKEEGEDGKEEEEEGKEDDGTEGIDDGDDDDDEEEAMAIELGSSQLPWEGSDRDYTYDELLGRVFNILRENNPELAGEKRRTIMRPPQVLREGTKKTVFVNLMDLCKTMHRQPEHVMAFLLAELGTSGSLDGQQRLVVKGRFAPKNFEGILRRYVNEYVMCNGCKSPDTTLTKENRLFFLRCEQCGSGRSVAPIKAGFVARVGRRKA